MGSVGYVAVGNEGMYDTIECVCHRGGSKKMATFTNGMFGGENSMRGVGAHVTEKALSSSYTNQLKDLQPSPRGEQHRLQSPEPFA